MDRPIITTVTGQGYVKYLFVFLKSLFENNKENEFEVYIMTNKKTSLPKKQINEIAKEYKRKIHYLLINEEKYLGFESMKGQYGSYYRLEIQDNVLQDKETCIYLDIDMIVDGNIKELLEIDLGNNWLACCPDNYVGQQLLKAKLGIQKDKVYYNTGLSIMNLKEIRKNKVFDKAIQIKKNKPLLITMQDQDPLNLASVNHVLELPRKYNYQSSYNFWMIDKPIIYHMTPIKAESPYSKKHRQKIYLKYGGKINEEWVLKGYLNNLKIDAKNTLIWVLFKLGISGNTYLKIKSLIKRGKDYEQIRKAYESN